jgi:hypothetical protein
VHVICPKCSFYLAVEISGRRQQADCPQCGSFAGEPDREGGLLVKCVCPECGLGHAVDVLAARPAFDCSDCGHPMKLRDREALVKLAEVWRLRSEAPPLKDAHAEATARVNLDEMDLAPDLVARVPASVAAAYGCVPIRWEHDVLTVAIAEPVREGVLEDLALIFGCTVQGAASPRAAVERAIRRAYGGAAEGD